MDYNLWNPWIHTDNEQINREKIKLLFIVEHSVLTMEGMTELENHHFATFILIILLGKNHQWIQKLVGGNLIKNRIYT